MLRSVFAPALSQKLMRPFKRRATRATQIIRHARDGLRVQEEGDCFPDDDGPDGDKRQGVGQGGEDADPVGAVDMPRGAGLFATRTAYHERMRARTSEKLCPASDKRAKLWERYPAVASP